MKPTVLFISCEHAVNHVPADYHPLLAPTDPILKTHRAMDFGALTLAKAMSEACQCEYINATVSRLLIDCNRSVTHPHCFSEYTASLPAKDKQHLLTHYYQPYRQAVEAAIQAKITQGAQVFHISSHSFTPVFQGKTRNNGIGLLYDPKRHGEKEVARQWQGLLSQQTHYRVRMNYPYRGSNDGFTSHLRKCHPEQDYLGLELEVNQILVNDADSFKPLITALSSSLQELLQLL